jgi:hypothetical protein
MTRHQHEKAAAIFLALVIYAVTIAAVWSQKQRADEEVAALEEELRVAAEVYESQWAPQLVDMEQLLDEVRAHESVNGTQLFGDAKLGRCGMAVGEYHMRVSTLEWLRRSQNFPAPRGCEAQRKWLLDPANARMAAETYLRILLVRTGDLDVALCLYNAGHNSKRTVCAYSGKVRNGGTA